MKKMKNEGKNNYDQQNKTNRKKKIRAIENKISNAVKKIIYTGLLIGSYYIGEFYQPAHKIEHFIEFHNRSVEDKNLCNYEDYKVIPIINDKGRVETYFGNTKTNSFHRILADETLDTMVRELDEKYVKNEWRFRK